MTYTKEAMRVHLRALGIWKFDWAGNNRDEMLPAVKKANPAATSGGFHEIVEYCWKAYESALNSKGDMVIGRTFNLEKTYGPKNAPVAGADLYNKVGDIVGDMTLFDPESKGNLLKMDKWAAVMNDAWILGGVHRQAKFRLASRLMIKNLWNTAGYFIVTARELVGLISFGYEQLQVGPWQFLVLRKDLEHLAASADLLTYDAVIKSRQTPQTAQKLVDREGSNARAAQQVRDNPLRPRGHWNP